MQKKASDLLSNAEKHAKRLAEEALQQEVDANIQKLCNKQLEFKAKNCGQRKKSTKGKTTKLLKGFEAEEWKKDIGEIKDKKRTNSIRRDRTNQIRSINQKKEGKESDSEDEKKNEDRDAKLKGLLPGG